MFSGDDVTETLATIIKGEPDWAALPENTPPTIHLLLRKCLNKDRKRRLRDIGDARIDLEQALGDPTSSIIRLSDRALQESTKPTGTQRILAIGVMLGGLVAGSLVWFMRPLPPSPLPRWADLNIHSEDPITTRFNALALSPTGDNIICNLVNEFGLLYFRSLTGDGKEGAIAGTDQAVSMFFSPDGKSIVFFTLDGSLMRVPADGGAPD